MNPTMVKEIKTIKAIDSEIAEVMNETWFTKAQHNKICRRLQFLRMCKMYLESNPTIDFIIKEKKRLENRLDLIEERSPDSREEKRKYNSTMNVKHTKDQLRTVKFILG